MNNSAQHCRIWLIYSVVTWTLLVTVLRAVRMPNTWAVSQWLLDYRFGFIRRGLVGTLATLTCRLFGKELSLEFIICCSAVIMAMFVFVILVVVSRMLRNQAANDRAELATFLFISSPFIVMNAHLFGYFDTLLYLLSITAILLILRGKYYLAAGVQAIGVLCHESFLVIGFPAACLAAFLNCRSVDWNQKYRRLLAQCLPLAAIVAIVLAMRAMDSATLKEEIVDHYNVSGLDTGASNQLAVFQARNYLENFERNRRQFLMRSLRSDIWIQIGPVLGCFFFLICSTFRIHVFSRLSLLLLGMIFAPFTVHALAFDTMRISTYSIGSAWLVYWVLSETWPETNSLPPWRGFYVFCGATLVYQVFLYVTLYDRESDRFSITWRLLLYAPMLLIFAGMALQRFFPREKKSSLVLPSDAG